MKKAVFTAGIAALILMVINPTLCKDGAIYGLMLSSNVIIPSIFPFSVFVLFVLKCSFLGYSRFSLFLLSLIGGYPIGAKVLNNATELKRIDKTTAETMLNYCVNAGPAFIILAVGSGILGSKKLGYILFFSHISASFVLFLLSRKPKITPKKAPKTDYGIIENFVLSVSESASAVISICSFVVIFSVILNYLNFYSKNFSVLKNFGFLLEVTNAVTQNKNLIFISFMLGFGGFCVWFQVLSQVKSFKINYLKFALFRILHGVLSGSFTLFLIKVLKINVPTFSNGITANYTFSATSPAAAISLIIMGIIFVISVYGKNYAGNLLEDLV